jgi:hypothetical protein
MTYRKGDLKLGNLGKSGTEMAPKFDLFRHSLFSYEDTHANAESFRYFLLRRNSPDSKGRIHSRPYALVVKVLRGESLKARGRFYFRRWRRRDEAIKDPRPDHHVPLMLG